MLSDEWLPRYRPLENFNIKWNGNGNAHGNGNAYDRGDYNSSFALCAVELKMKALECLQNYMTFFRRSRATNSQDSSRILSNFELIQAFIVVLVTCKYEEDPIRNEGAKVLTRFSQL